MPRSLRRSANHSNSSGGSSGSTTTVILKPWSVIHRPAHSHPPRCGSARITPLPPSSASVTWWQPSIENAALDCALRQRRQPEALHVVAGVAVERCLRRDAQRGAGERRVDAAQVPLDHLPPGRRWRGWHRSPRRRGCGRDRPGHQPRGERAEPEACRRWPRRPDVGGHRRELGVRHGSRSAIRIVAGDGDPGERSRAAPFGAHDPAALPAAAAHLDPLADDRRDRRLLPHLDEPLDRGDRREHEHDPQDRDQQRR